MRMPLLTYRISLNKRSPKNKTHYPVIYPPSPNPNKKFTKANLLKFINYLFVK